MKSVLCALMVVVGLLVTGCHAPVSVTTAQGKAAFTADQVVVRVNELQNAAIQAEAVGAVPTATTRRIISFCVDADRTLAATPSGWQQTVTVAWAAAKKELGSITNPAVVAAMGGVDVALATLGGQ